MSKVLKKTVGQAAYDALHKPEDNLQVQEIIDAYAPSYTKEMQKCIEENIFKFESPFFIVVLHKKEHWTTNVMRNWFVARQTKPLAKTLVDDYPNHMKTVYEYDCRSQKLDLLWSLPSAQDATTIMNNKSLYHLDLVKWIVQFQENKI